MIKVAGAVLLTIIVSYWGVTCVRRWTEHCHILDIPNERSSHVTPIPRGGGLAIVVLSLVGLVTSWLIHPVWPLWTLSTYLFGAVLVASVSWLDDLRPLSNRVRFTAHSVGALLAILSFGYWRSLDIPIAGPFHLGWPGLLVTFLWVVGLTNAYNFMDGIDGIAGGQAVVAGTGWAVLGWLGHQPLIAALGLLLAATSLGFLGHNWPPACIFMGDVGSAFLGYTFAVLPVLCAQNDVRSPLAGVLLVWPFLFDTTFTFFRRLRKGENVFAAHRSHLYQRLVIAGYSHRFVALLYICFALIGMVLALAWDRHTGAASFSIPILIPLLCLSLWVITVRKERRQALRLEG